ncbi:MAG: alpha/beta fold hydrolase [Myxococcaceae bacterium]
MGARWCAGFVRARGATGLRVPLGHAASCWGPPADGERPALIVWGDRDVAFRATERERFERAFPNHRTVILKGAGHFIQEDVPEEIALAIRSWFVP